jgi:hypothetical protein
MIARRWLEKARPRVEKSFLAPAGDVVETLRVIRIRMQISFVRRRAAVQRRFPAPAREGTAPRVLAVVTHVTDPSSDRALGVERLAQTLDGLLESFDHARVTLVLNTLPGRHVVADLPPHQRSLLAIRERVGVEPMFVGFEAQEEFVRRADEFDWFFYLEDDLVLGDSLVLEKLDYFNDGAPASAVLLPHRYELWNGRKSYIDLRSRRSPGEHRSTNRLTTIAIADWKFAEFANPHSGCYCLSRRQLGRWLDAGRHWYGLSSYVGPRESAATGCLEECFRIYKPHPDNMNFLEIRHLGTKYAEFYANVHGVDASKPASSSGLAASET